MSGPVFQLTCDLIRRPSVTPDDAGCQELIASRLSSAGFSVTRYDAQGVSNLWCTCTSDKPGPLVMFAGHTDVVPPGDPRSWRSPPFEPEVRDGRLYGRGAADMKSSLAAMVVAAERLLNVHRTSGTIAFLITSDEEGDALHGTRHVVEQLTKQNVQPRFCVVGEPTSNARLGDVARNGRRGSLNARLRVLGTQGHVAYAHLADNPAHALAPALAELVAIKWDEGDEYYPPTGLQVSNVHGGTGASNVIPGEMEVRFNFRYNTQHTAASLQDAVCTLLDRHGLRYDIEWQLSGEPFITQSGRLIRTVQEAVRAVTGQPCVMSTAGGTSDGRFIAPMGCDVVELGHVNQSIHKIDENVAVHDLEDLSAIYLHILRMLGSVS
ncbi:MAG: succinyl-diaminopimelate desuccinylase [Pseudomonadales bacterium]|jgi:succinyl-diaminopimelate desuccinylase|nr:succinyl-diaminopimelate desuccinylase [Pseudomonadales bacterium]MDP6471695.1 succinyl-diaminopimelate desuccinylase [Pseudomonadales bacterium]MDP6972209.1 succinyl-diaminopimelate desuccinylase [Pseudomonadales bacterium]|tara:strand:- start:1422 stop:2561 length:1140 start_codon:yes stop_codon:yes gene_type:complete